MIFEPTQQSRSDDSLGPAESKSIFFVLLVFVWEAILLWIFLPFSIHADTENRPKTDQKKSKKQRKMRCNFTCVLDRIWVPIWSQICTKLGPSWHQKSIKNRSQSHRRAKMQQDASKMEQNGTTWAHQGGTRIIDTTISWRRWLPGGGKEGV